MNNKDLITSYLEKYYYFKFNEYEIKEIIFALLNNNNLNDNIIYNEIIIILSKRLNNKDDILLLLNQFIDYNFILNIKDYSKVISFIGFINDLSVSLDPDIIIKLFDNKTFNKVISNIYKKHKYNDINFDLIINTFEMINNINTDIKLNDNDFVNCEDSLKMYLKSINNFPLLSKEEEHELALEAKKGNNAARNRFIESNLKLCVSAALKYRNRGVDVMDLIQEANIGLMIAVDKYDPSYNFRFSTYAYNWIYSYINNMITYKSRMIKLPKDLVDDINRYRYSELEYISKFGKTPTLKELASYLNKPYDEIIKYERYIFDTGRSLNELVNEEEDTEIIDLIKDDNIDIQEQSDTINRSDIINLLKSCNLTDNELKVLLYRYGFIDGKCYELHKIGEIFNVTRERIRQIENNALNKIRKSGTIQNFINYANNPDDASKKLDSYRINKLYRINTVSDLRKLCTLTRYKNINNLRDIFYMFTYDDLNNAYNSLSIRDKEKINKVFDNNFNVKDCYGNKDLLEAFYYTYNHIIPKLYNTIVGKYNKSLTRKK